MGIFYFKNFQIKQSDSVFKIGTDSILCGSFVEVEDCQKALEIGTGTGVISMMMAQKNPKLEIDAIEIHHPSYLLAKENTKQLIDNQRLKLFHTAIQNFIPNTSYDAIISNPPYFDRSSMKSKTLVHARQQQSLCPEDIFEFANQFLNPAGSLQIIYPYLQHKAFLDKALKYSLYPKKLIFIRGQENTELVRVFIKLCRKHVEPQIRHFIIEKSRGEFTEEYKNLTRDFHPMF